MALSASSRAIAVELAAAPARTGELRHFPFRRLPFGTGKRRANQPPMHGALVVGWAFLDLIGGSGWCFLGCMLNRFFHERRFVHRNLFCERLG
jgi:hypothetical protein